MRNDIRINPWCIETEGPVDDFCESVFFSGNGNLGIRGFGAWEQKRRLYDHAVFKAGLFSHIKPGITDMILLPDLLTMQPAAAVPEKVHQKLNLKNGVLTHAWEDDHAYYQIQRMISMKDRQAILQRLKITAKEDFSATICTVESARTANLPVHDDQMIQSTDVVTLLEMEHLAPGVLDMHTVAEGIPVHFRWTIASDRDAAKEEVISGDRITTDWRANLRAGETWKLEKMIQVYTGDETPQAGSSDPWAENEAAWALRWQDSDIRIEADDPDLQGAVRWNIFQMIANNADFTPDASIGARGLTHGRYKGNTFWDTDIFLFPFYLWTNQQAARNLLLYRVNRMDAARALARKQNLQGVRFPWMCAADGTEQCESWDIGCCEIHITADVAYAADRYLQITGDQEFEVLHAKNLFLETGRYWLSRVTWEPKKECYSLFFVKGPDEYCGAAMNNTYTNYLARHNLLLASEAAEKPEEKQKLRDTAERMTILYDPQRDLFLQDEAQERMEPLKIPKDHDAPLYQKISFDRLQRYRVLKQADLVLLMCLFPKDFTDAQKRNVFEAYEPITLHDSTLSWGIHALLAFRLGLWQKGIEYLNKSAYLDLRDRMENTGREGVHMAALGALWQALVYGIAGLWNEEKQLTLEPMLPEGIHSISFPVQFRGKKYRVAVDHAHQTIKEE